MGKILLESYLAKQNKKKDNFCDITLTILAIFYMILCVVIWAKCVYSL